MFEIHTSIKYKKQRKRLALSDRILLDDIVYKLANNETLERKYKDHKLKGEFKDFRECHIRPNLLLIYQRQEDILVLTCVEVGSHSELFDS